jgi:ring-1,2-phenylacetyl-CoA epoxidase subunit PaaD
VAARLAGMAADVQVEMTFAEPWTSERITADGRRKLRESGFAPPRSVACPYCRSRDTRLENPFGPTRCRAIFWCNHCRQPFEQFKVI